MDIGRPNLSLNHHIGPTILKHFTVFYNPKSGSGVGADKLRSAFADHNLKADFIGLSDSLSRDVARATEARHIVVAAGGDGTVQAIASELLNSSGTLGVIPVGTLNHFASDAGIPTDLREAVANLDTGSPKLIDVASVNGRAFVNNSSIGIYPAIVDSRDERINTLGKWPAAAIGVISALRHLKRYQLRLAIDDGDPISRTTPFLFIGNNCYGIDKVGFSNREALDRGQLCLYLIRCQRVIPLARIVLRAILGRIDREQDLEVFDLKAVTINCRYSKLNVALDGEIATMETPLKYEIKPKSLRVITPDA